MKKVQKLRSRRGRGRRGRRGRRRGKKKNHLKSNVKECSKRIRELEKKKTEDVTEEEWMEMNRFKKKK